MTFTIHRVTFKVKRQGTRHAVHLLADDGSIVASASISAYGASDAARATFEEQVARLEAIAAKFALDKGAE